LKFTVKHELLLRHRTNVRWSSLLVWNGLLWHWVIHAEESQLDLPQKTQDQLVWKCVHDPVASAKDNKTVKIAQIYILKKHENNS
jgi:hypothetical protein